MMRLIPAPAFSKAYVSPAQTVVAGGYITLAHGLGVVPKLITLQGVCLIADLGYAVGERIVDGHALIDSTNHMRTLTVKVDATNIYGVWPTTSNMAWNNWGTGVVGALTIANWDWYVGAFA